MKRGIIAVLLAILILNGCASPLDTSRMEEVNEEETSDEDEDEDEDEKKDKDDKKESSKKVVDNRDKKNKASNEKVSDEDFDKTGYLYETLFDDSMYFYVIKNNSKATVGIDGNATAYDSEGTVLGASRGSIDVLGPGEESLMSFYFSGVSGVDKVDVQLSYDNDIYYSPVISNLNMEQTINDKNATVTLTNKGDSSAQFVEVHALFFDSNDKVLSHSFSYVVDGDSEIKPGATLSAQLDAYKEFDHVECYLTGRSDGTVTEKSSGGVSEKDFSIKEYPYTNMFGDSMYFLVLTNNSDSLVGININMTAYDADENVIGAATSTVDVIDSGEESIAGFYFSNVDNIDHVSYVMSFDTSPYYKSVLSDLDVVQNVNNKNVVVAVTNNGDKPAQFVQVYALFLDSSGKVVNYSSSYVVDGDSEIKPGATLSTQLDSYDAFDTVECYLTGRKDK